jgi:methionyl-tRNA formyltransferase
MWAIQNGETEFGVTLHEIDEGIDTGDIVLQEVYPIEPTETGYDLYLKAMNLSSKMLINNLDKIISKNYNKKTQVGYGSYYGKYSGKAFINWASRAVDIVNFIRARAKPFNPAQTSIYNSYICINRAQVYNSKELTAVVPGTIIKILDNCKILVACSDGCITLEEYDIFPPLTDVTKKIYLKEGTRLK